MNNNITFSYLINIVLLLSTFELIIGSQLHVSIHDPIYNFLDRQSTQGFLPDFMNSSLPLNRDYITDMLIILDENRNNLSVVDQKILDEYLADFTYELEDKSYFQLEDGENTYHPLQSVAKFKRGLRDVLNPRLNFATDCKG